MSKQKEEQAYQSYWSLSWKLLRKNRMAMFCLIVVILLVLMRSLRHSWPPMIRTYKISPSNYKPQMQNICLEPMNSDVIFYLESSTVVEYR